MSRIQDRKGCEWQPVPRFIQHNPQRIQPRMPEAATAEGDATIAIAIVHWEHTVPAACSADVSRLGFRLLIQW